MSASGNASRLRARLCEGPPAWLPNVATWLTVAATVAIGRTTAEVGIALALAVLVGAILAPPLGLVALIAGGLASPIAFATPSRTSIEFPLLIVPVLGALWLIEALWRRDFAVLRLPAVRAICTLALVAALAAAVGNLPWVGFGRTAPLTAQLGGVCVFIFSAASVVLAADHLRDMRWLRRITWVFLLFSALVVASRLMPEFTDVSDWLMTGGAAGSLTWTWFAALASAQAIVNRDLNWRIRLLLGLAVMGELYYGLGAGREWIAGWLPPLVAVATMTVLAAPWVGGALLGLGAAAMAFNLHRVVARVMGGDNQYSLATRFDAARIILGNIIPANPLLGLGPANYYHVTPLFPIRGYAVSFSSHNTYVDLLAQTGLIGLLCFGWFVWAMARRGWQLYRRAPSGFARAYAIGVCGGLMGTLAAGGLGDWVLPFVYNVTLVGLRSSLPAWLFFGGLLALGRRPEIGADMRLTAAEFWTTPRLLAAVTAGAVLLRVAVAIMLGDTAQPISGAADQFSYDTLALRVLDGHGFSFPTEWYPYAEADAPTAHWSYLYTLYLAAVYGIVGHHPLAARLLQVIASGAGCWLIFRIGRRVCDEQVGLAAALLTAVYAYFVFFNAALMTQTFYILAVLGAFDRALAIAARPTRAAWATLGVCLGIGVVLRQTLLLFAPLLLAWTLWMAHGRARWRDAVLAAGMLALCVVPWTVYNYVTFGDFLLLNSNGGYFLYSANHPDHGTQFDPTRTPPIPDALRGLPEPAVDRALFRAAIGFVVADPVRFLRLSWSRVGSYFWVLPSNDSATISNLARLCSFALYLPLMLFGLALTRDRWRLCLPIYMYVLVDTALHLASWAAPRYRLPSDALLMIFAGAAVVAIGRRSGLIVHRAGGRDATREGATDTARCALSARVANPGAASPAARIREFG